MKASPLVMGQPDDGYPTSEEWHVPETEWHRISVGRLIEALAWFYRAENVCVTGRIDVWPTPDRSYWSIRPDVFVALGAERRRRGHQYLVWEEGAAPDLVIELVTRHTKAGQRKKFSVCQQALRVREYCLLDIEGGLLSPRLQGYRLLDGVYQPIEPLNGRLHSVVTGLHLEQDGDALRLWDPATNAWVPTDAERAEQQIARADAAEERVRQLEAELARRGGTP